MSVINDKSSALVNVTICLTTQGQSAITKNSRTLMPTILFEEDISYRSRDFGFFSAKIQLFMRTTVYFSNWQSMRCRQLMPRHQSISNLQFVFPLNVISEFEVQTFGDWKDLSIPIQESRELQHRVSLNIVLFTLR
jgi:hypothetical protein